MVELGEGLLHNLGEGTTNVKTDEKGGGGGYINANKKDRLNTVSKEAAVGGEEEGGRGARAA